MKDYKKLYFDNDYKIYLYKKMTLHPDYLFYKAVIYNTKYRNAKEKNNIFKKIFYSFFANRYASKFNLELYGKFGKNLRIYHGNIVINGNAQLGNNVKLHGNNCIGENYGKSPSIGNNVDIGFGAVLIGNIEIGDNCIIGANTIVNKSFPSNSVIVGNPCIAIKGDNNGEKNQ